MSPSETLSQSLKDYPPLVRAEAPVQLCQGWYYVVVGTWVAVAVGMFQSTTEPVLGLSHMWLIRVVGALVAIFGIAMIYASRRKDIPPLGISAPIGVAILLGCAEVVALANGLLPATFLLDAGMQFGFIVWWGFAVTHRRNLADAIAAQRRALQG